MPLVSVRAVFDHGEVTLLEKPPVHDRYKVLVTFLAPELESQSIHNQRMLTDLRGVWRGIDLSFEEIQAAEYRLPESL